MKGPAQLGVVGGETPQNTKRQHKQESPSKMDRKFEFLVLVFAAYFESQVGYIKISD